MATAPSMLGAPPDRYCLVPFEPPFATTIAAWVRSDHELFWLAPKTFPPLTPAKIVAWTGADGSPLLFFGPGAAEPSGYVELNPMPGEVFHLWMGHCVICPERRGAGLGRTMIELMLRQAFLRQQATRVSLVVFPENAAAIRCYWACGFEDDREQMKYFPTTGRQHRMLQMSIRQHTYEAQRRSAGAPRSHGQDLPGRAQKPRHFVRTP